jgi:hypothetical protein
MDIAKCGDVGGTLVTWQGTNTTTAPVPTALVGNDFTVWVEAHPDSNNGHGTPYHYEFGVPAKGSPLPVGTALGGLAVALLLGGGLMWRLRRRPSVQ